MNWPLFWGLIYCVDSNVVLSAVAVSLMKLSELSKSDVSVKKIEQEHEISHNFLFGAKDRINDHLRALN